MRGCRARLPLVLRAAARGVRQGTATLATRVAALVTRVAYRRQELIVIGLLSGSMLGGLGVEMWRQRDPTSLDRLEAEPPRLAPPPRAPSSRPAPGGGAPRPLRTPSSPPPPAADALLDLNHATEADLARLPGIGPRLAQRILARRQELGGRFESPDDLASVPGLGRRRATRVTALVTTSIGSIGRTGNPEPSSEGSDLGVPNTPETPP